MEFDVDGTDATPAVLEEYRAALAAYDRAGAARTASDALTALHDGRAAMIRLDARRHGRPVPIDALPTHLAAPVHPEPLTGTGERYVSTGQGKGKTEILIDRPEPGRPALLEIDVTGHGPFDIEPVIRTEDLTKTGISLITALHGEYHGRVYLREDATHLRVTAREGVDRWSIRIAPLSAATVLAPEHRGHTNEVLHYTGGPALLTIQFQNEAHCIVRYVCQCGEGDLTCRCRPPAWPKDTPGNDYWSAKGEGRATLRLPRPGFLLVGGVSDAWYLTTQPIDIPSPSPRGRKRR
ncbi:hypothetical protein AB5J56_02055 [Streptomyces sp. R21]|uniref:Uncharacterized protein n=1 Tax=Streptomyces sp. R21 TaxID=3238627 RepID=A0AB39NYV2_9ACTN